jgi:signal transduction histidine kinase
MIVFMNHLYFWLIKPKFKSKDDNGREFILNILLLQGCFLSFSAFSLNCVTYCRFSSFYNPMPLVSFSFFLFFVLLLVLSRLSFILGATLLFIAFLYCVTIGTLILWGADVPQGVLMLALVVTVTGTLLGTRSAFIITAAISVSLLAVTFLQVKGVYKPISYWKNFSVTAGDTLIAIFTLSNITIVSWLSNRRIESSLNRAQISEAALRKQRDHLEYAVEKRTQELQRAQLEKMDQVYRFAEFGKLASGLFHDLVNPLSLISINIGRLNENNQNLSSNEIKKSLDRAMTGTKQIESFVSSARKQLQNSDDLESISLKNEINYSIKLLAYKSKSAGIKVILTTNKDVRIMANSTKFGQILTNLISNAIDSYRDKKNGARVLEISFRRSANNLELTVQDWGTGIEKRFQKKIFDPLFTTKSKDGNLGMGLSICRDIVEKDFHGSVNINSRRGHGTLVKVVFPINRS